MPLEVVAEVEQRLVQGAAANQQERDEQPPNPTVVVEEGMDRFELGGATQPVGRTGFQCEPGPVNGGGAPRRFARSRTSSRP